MCLVMGEERHVFMDRVIFKKVKNIFNQVLNVWLWVYFKTM